MYRNQYEYDRAEPEGPSMREKLELLIDTKIDMGDDATLASYVEHCADMLDGDLVGNIMDAMIRVSDTKFNASLAALSSIDIGLAHMMQELGRHVESRRTEFIEGEAQRLMDEAADQ